MAQWNHQHCSYNDYIGYLNSCSYIILSFGFQPAACEVISADCGSDSHSTFDIMVVILLHQYGVPNVFFKDLF